MTSTEYAVEAKNLELSFGSVSALRGASMQARTGEVTAIIGDNGAGKSSFMKCLLGINHPDQGEILVNGTPRVMHTPRDASEAGIEAVLQDLALFDNLTLWQNMFIGRELTRGIGPIRFTDRRQMIDISRERISALTKNVPDVRRTVNEMSGGQRQSIAIARAVAWGSSIVLMDEPSAALGVRERTDVENIITGLRDQGRSSIVVTHSFDQVLRVADAVWVMRHGRFVASRRVAETDGNELVGLVTGTIAADSAPTS